MAQLYFWLLLNLVIVVKGADDQLEAVIVIFRHGDRTPIKPYPNDPYKDKSYWPVGFGQLTNEGKQRHYQLGRWLRSRYDGFLPSTYSENDIYVRSTDIDRTLMSAEANLAGLYPPTSSQTWNPDLKWEPIPVHTEPQKTDALLAMKKPCPKYDKLYKQVMKSDYFRNISHQNHDLYAYLTKHSGEVISDIPTLQFLHNNLFIETLFNYTLPDWATKVYPGKLEPWANLAFAMDTFTKDLARLKTGLLMNHIVTFFRNHTINAPETRKFLMLSGHDTTIANVLNTLGAFQYHCPPYASTIIFELRTRLNGQHYVNVLYKNSTDPRPINVRNCDVDCDFDDFVDKLKPYALSLDQWEMECRIRWAFVWPLTFQWNIILICSLITVILLLSAVIVGIRKNRKENDNNYIQLPNEEYA
ncbi:unnamed protein product [Phyllotreta striolata]|uniref:acid phosphatase n=1 Tax=Phyllotreta striolata TaxID=444603 RepID=A0A9N9TVV6_PHYSR|nr:unnamed protein product [Phyllotreta striolata]